MEEILNVHLNSKFSIGKGNPNILRYFRKATFYIPCYSHMVDLRLFLDNFLDNMFLYNEK